MQFERTQRQSITISVLFTNTIHDQML